MINTDILIKHTGFLINIKFVKNLLFNGCLITLLIYLVINEMHLCDMSLNESHRSHSIQFKELLNEGVIMNNNNYDNQNSLLIAVSNNDTNRVKFLIEQGADVNLYDVHKKSALSLAAEYGSYDCIELLLKYNANINHHDALQNTPLHIAALHLKMPAIQTLIKNGALINSVNNNAETPLLVLVKKIAGSGVFAEEYIRTIELFLKYNADINTVDKEGNTPLSLTLRNSKTLLPVAKMLINNGANPLIDHKWQNNAFETALIKNQFDVFDLMLENGADLNYQNNQGMNLLMLAIYNFNTNAANMLIDKGINLDARDYDGNTTLMRAAHLGDVETGKYLLENGARITTENEHGETALYIAVNEKQHDFIKLLLNYNANANHTTKNGTSMLMCAARMNYDEIVQLLIDNGANIEQTDPNGNTALFLTTPYKSLDAMKVLLKNGANIHHINNLGSGIIHCICGDLFYDEEFARINTGYTAKDLLLEVQNAGLDINQLNKNNKTALLIAVTQNNANSVELLLELGTDINFPTDDGNTPLIYTVAKNNIEAVKTLLQNGADVNIKNKAGNPALIVASFYESSKKDAQQHVDDLKTNAEIMDLLIKQGADINAINEQGITALMHSVSLVKTSCINLLLENKADVNIQDKKGDNALSIAVLYADNKILEQLLTNGANVNIADAKGFTPLLESCFIDDYEKTKTLLNHNANIESTTNNGDTPLILAAKQDNANCVQLFLEHKANINAQNEVGFSALHYCKQHLTTNTAQILINKGIDINLLTKQGESALTMACQSNNTLLAKLLISSGAKVNHGYHFSNSALNIAVETNHCELVDLLLIHGAHVNPENSISPLQVAIKFNRLNILKKLIEQGADIKAHTHKGDSYLSYAYFLNRTEIVEHLLRKGAKWQVPGINEDEFLNEDAHTLDENFSLKKAIVNQFLESDEVIHQKIIHNDTEGVALLLKNKVFNDNHYHHMLTYLASNNKTEMLKVFLNSGFSVDSSGENNYTILMAASIYNNVNMVKQLLYYQPDADIIDSYGSTALGIAMYYRNYEIITLLMQYGATMVSDDENITEAFQIRFAEDNRMFEAIDKGNSGKKKKILFPKENPDSYTWIKDNYLYSNPENKIFKFKIALKSITQIYLSVKENKTPNLLIAGERNSILPINSSGFNEVYAQLSRIFSFNDELFFENWNTNSNGHFELYRRIMPGSYKILIEQENNGLNDFNKGFEIQNETKDFIPWDMPLEEIMEKIPDLFVTEAKEQRIKFFTYPVRLGNLMLNKFGILPQEHINQPVYQYYAECYHPTNSIMSFYDIQPYFYDVLKFNQTEQADTDDYLLNVFSHNQLKLVIEYAKHSLTSFEKGFTQLEITNNRNYSR